MAKLDGIKVDVSLSHTRPCWAEGKKALFHKFTECDMQIINGLGEFKATTRTTMAIVEFEDGSVRRVELKNIEFLDNNINEIYYV